MLNMNRINAVSFSTISPDSELHNLLSALDLPVHFSTYENLPVSKVIDAARINIFVFDDPDCCSDNIRQKVLSYIQENSHCINFCICSTIPDKNCLTFFSNFHDFLFLPCEVEELKTRIMRFQLLFSENKSNLENKLLEEFSSLNLTGQSDIFLQVLELIKRIADCHAPVLIQGETGTGKENAARSIHYLSERKDRGFVPVNCGAIPDSLLEGELFGHEKGAFTDARNRQAGLVEIASGGTLFLDEVDSLSPKAQAALLRFLQTHEYRPLGAKQIKKADVRIVAATNADLEARVESNHFREDLYFRLNVLYVNIPSLRERKSDIPLIANKLLENFALQHNMPLKKLSHQAVIWLQQQQWHGNVRELENVLLREFLLTDGPLITLGMDKKSNLTEAQYNLELSDDEQMQLSFQEAKAIAIHEFEQRYLQQVLSSAAGNVSKAARLAGKERRALGKLLKKYKIDKEKFSQVISA